MIKILSIPKTRKSLKKIQINKRLKKKKSYQNYKKQTKKQKKKTKRDTTTGNTNIKIYKSKN